MNDIYEKLRQHFNTGAASKLRKTKELMEILKILFTEKQARCAMALPLSPSGRSRLKDVAEKLNEDPQQVRIHLENMAREGKVLVMTSRKDGQEYFALWPLLPGILESTFADGIDSDHRRRLARLVDKYNADAGWNEIASSDYPQFRIIPVNASVQSAQNVLPFEEVNRLIEAADVITVIPCLCRTTSRKCDHLLEADFVFGAWADYLIKYRGARRWSREEALRRLKKCEEDGLMHLTANVQTGSTVICNCCICCCKALRGLTQLHNPRSLVRSNFAPVIDREKCTLCLTCQKICPMTAVSKLPGLNADGSDSRMIVQGSRCVGCGLCQSHCPEDAIRMDRVRNNIPASNLREMNDRYLRDKIW